MELNEFKRYLSFATNQFILNGKNHNLVWTDDYTNKEVKICLTWLLSNEINPFIMYKWNQEVIDKIFGK